MKQGVFITGTGTDVGKTYITGQIVKVLHDAKLSVGYFKPALSGAPCIEGKLIPEDAMYVKKIANLNMQDILVSHIYKHPYSPHLSARLEKQVFSIQKVKSDIQAFQQEHDLIITEGCGGIICPLWLEKEQIFLHDIIKLLQYPLIIVTESGLGAINQTLLTIEFAKTHLLPIIGVIMNRFDHNNPIHKDNKDVIEHTTHIPVLSCVSNEGYLDQPDKLYKAIVK